MDEQEEEYCSVSVRENSFLLRKTNGFVYNSVINTFKPMLTDEDIHEKEGFVRPRLNERIRVVGGGSSSYRIAVVVWR